MKIFTELNNEYKNLALALGFFDGVHRGHQAVIASAVDFAQKNVAQSAVVTFKEHPQVLLRGCAPAYISTEALRREKLAALGVDLLFELDFKDFSNIYGEEYIKLLVQNFEPISISTGFNHYFGAQKSGTPELLEKYALGYKYFKTPPVEIEGEVASSSLIRKHLAAGDIKKANALLGYNFVIESTVQDGAKLASRIGFKTANLAYPEGLVSLPYGVYSVLANGRPAIANFGVKPTFSGLATVPVLEVHILNFNENIYGENLRIEFIDFIRHEKKFDSVEDLIAQIKSDILACKGFYGNIDV